MCKMMLLAILLTICILHGSYADEESHARLLVSKQIMNKYLVEEKDVVVEYKIFNVGGSWDHTQPGLVDQIIVELERMRKVKCPALNVQLSDNTFKPEDFQVVSGMLKIKIDRIAPGTNTTHTVVLRPSSSGYMNFSAAEISYRVSDDADRDQIGFTSEPGEGGVVPFRDYDRKFSPHVLDWGAFAVMILPSLAIPFLLWYSSKLKYEALVKQTKRH